MYDAMMSWLGGVVELDEDQEDAFFKIWEDAEHLIPDSDYLDEGNAFLLGALETILGETTLKAEGTQWKKSDPADRTAKARLVGVIRAAIYSGTLYTEVCEKTSLDPDTVWDFYTQDSPIWEDRTDE